MTKIKMIGVGLLALLLLTAPAAQARATYQPAKRYGVVEYFQVFSETYPNGYSEDVIAFTVAGTGSWALIGETAQGRSVVLTTSTDFSAQNGVQLFGVEAGLYVNYEIRLIN